jgi:hypothetical protein
LQTEIEIRELTLAHISRELHDNLGQIASLIKINLNMVSNSVSTEDRAKVEESIDLLKRLIGDIKALSLSLNSESIGRMGLFAALLSDVERINRMGSLKVTLHCKNTLPHLKPDTVVFLYRMCQEVLNNTLKHAEASQAEVTLDQEGEMLTLCVSDNGKGFDPQTAIHNGNGSGLANLNKRCRLIGATLRIDSGPGKGVKICITLPLNQ